MTRNRPHPVDQLTEAFVRSVRAAGFYGDGNGLYLKVDRSGAKRWILRTVVQGKRRDLELGSVSLTSLAEARVKARVYRKIARAGGDPTAARQHLEKLLSIAPAEGQNVG